MAYSIEVIHRARQRLAQAKVDRESENQEHLDRAYALVPRLKEIDRLLRQTMTQVAQAVFVQGGDVVEAMNRAKEANLSLQQERAALIAENFEEGFLDDTPLCECCGGNGYVGSTMCECLKELCRQEQKKQLKVLNGGRETFDQFRLDYYSDRYDSKIGASPRSVMEKVFKNCLNYARNFSSTSGNLLFTGYTGLGKTFLSACIAKSVSDSGFSVIYESAHHLFSKLEKAKFSPSEQSVREAEALMECDLLIVDDLGTEMPSQFVTAALYSLLNDRLMEHKAMVISTNLNVDEIAQRYTQQIASRLYGNFTRLTFVGEDIRVIKNRVH